MPHAPHVSAPNREGILGRVRRLMVRAFQSEGIECTRRNYQLMNELFDKQYGTQEMENQNRWHLEWWNRGGTGLIDKMCRDIAVECLEEEKKLRNKSAEDGEEDPDDPGVGGDEPSVPAASTTKKKTAKGKSKKKPGAKGKGGTPPAAELDNSDPLDDANDDVEPDPDANEGLEPEG